MQLPFTDKFLLDLYNLIEKIDETADSFFPPRTMEEVCCPEFFKLKRDYERQKERQRFSQLIYYLKKKGYIKIKNLKQKQGALLTKRGIDRVLKIKFKTFEKKKRSDGKWQMIIFDIPEEKRNLRNLLRQNLQILEYKILQKSIWVSPYDVLKETEEIIRKYSLDSYVKLFLIEEVKI
ncbi:hypothetical protein HY750_00755 [Candidatus Kuenenbacteria bacterium]|nr:hypothetical protein [Candidatus Kuenenbacteria bacterium]